MSSAVQYEDDREEQWDDTDDETPALPGRPRRQLFNRWTAALLALITCAIGFYAGIRVEKGQVSSSSGTARGFALPAALAGSGAGSSTRGTSSAASGARSSGSAAGFAGRGAGFAGAFARRQRLDRNDFERQRQHDLHHRRVREHGQGDALVGDQDHQEPGRLKALAAPR